MQIDQQKASLIGIVWCFIGAIMFSVKAIFVKLVYQYDIDSVSLLTLRMLISLPFFLLIGYYSNRTSVKQSALKTKDWISVILIGLSGYYLASLLDFTGLQYITAGMERLILYMYPTVVLILSAMFYKRKVSRIQFMALLLTYLGISLALFDENLLASGQQIWLGAALVAGAALAYAVYVVQSGEIIPRVGTFRFTSISMCAAAIAILLHNLVFYGLNIFQFVPQVYYYALAIAIISTVIPSLMISEGIRLVGANNAAIVGTVGPIATIILAYFFLEEVFTGMQVIGTVFVVLGVLLLSLNKKSART